MTKQYDLMIRNALVINGTGGPWQRGDVAVKGDRIAAMGFDLDGDAKLVIDADHLVLAPGFIDLHTHADQNIEQLSLTTNYLYQGVTTIIGGNCGYSVLPVSDHLGRLAQQPLTINYGTYAGHGSIRQAAMGLSMRAPSAEELTTMKELAQQALDQGAFGVSLGLYYTPGIYAELPEIIELARVVSEQGGLLPIHIRDESDYTMGLTAAIEEAIEIARQTEARVQISHLKCLGRTVWGKSGEILSLIEDARQEGLDVSFDQYPYTASGTSITGAIIPRWALSGGESALAERLQDIDTRETIRAQMLDNIVRRGGPEALVVALYEPDCRLNGMNLAQAGEYLSLQPVDAAIKMQLNGGARLVSFNMTEEDLLTIMRHPLGLVASDGSLVPLGEGVPHPRYYGTFPRVLGKFVRELGVISLEEAVRKMTSAPAARLGLWDRGVIAPGLQADLVLFDPLSIDDNSTFGSPHHYSTGIEYVIVNGKVALDQQGMTNERAGRILRK